NLGRNKMEGPIPTSIGTMTNLLDLDISSNKLTGQLLLFTNLTKLYSLRLSRSLLDGPIPPSISALSNLISL
ncbi:unnamed protein product, partial [Closterium sp. NIES-64]